MKMSEIIDMRNNGATYQEIAEVVGLSKQRVRTIILKHSPELKGTRGSALRRANDLINRQKAEIERYKGVIKLLEKDVQTAKSEAIKEFAERLRKKSILCSGCVPWYDVHEAIDNLVKEMTEQSTGCGSSKTEGHQ